VVADDLGGELTELLEPFADRLAVAVRGRMSRERRRRARAAGGSRRRSRHGGPALPAGDRARGARRRLDLGDAPSLPTRRGLARGWALGRADAPRPRRGRGGELRPNESRRACCCA